MARRYPTLSACPTWIPAKPNGDGDIVLRSLPGKAQQLELGPNRRSSVLVEIFPFHLPPLESVQIDLSKLQVSTRSCLAQSGVFLSIPDQTMLTLDDWKILEHGSSITKEAILNNHGTNTLIFKPGDHLARFFHLNENDLVSTSRLHELIETNYFTGQPDFDYRLFDKHSPFHLALKIDPQELGLPEGETIRVTSRQDLYRHASPITKSSKKAFHLMQTTSVIHLPDNIIGVIAPQMTPDSLTHLPSPLLDPGTSWKIRLETYGHFSDLSNAWIYLTLYESPLLNFNTRKSFSTYSPCLISPSIQITT